MLSPLPEEGLGAITFGNRRRLFSISCRAAAVIAGGREPGRLAEGGGERARLTEAKRQADIRHRMDALRQHDLAMLDARAGVIAVRRPNDCLKARQK